nr:amino acid dehydrogenase [Gammaproteobacteria bacterium]
MSVFQQDDFDGHEQVAFFQDDDTGLRAIIAVHNTNLGPALGGVRMWPYASDAEAVRDVLRLSRGMTYKSALAGLPFGGGKSVVIGDPQKEKSEALMQ